MKLAVGNSVYEMKAEQLKAVLHIASKQVPFIELYNKMLVGGGRENIEEFLKRAIIDGIVEA